MAVVEELKHDISLPKLNKFVKSVLSNTVRTSNLIKELEEIIIYKDVLFYTWRSLSKIVPGMTKNSDTFMLNVLELLEKTQIPKTFDEEDVIKPEKEEILGLVNLDSDEFVIQVSSLKKLERKVWQSLINRDFSLTIHRKLLLVLLESYLSRLRNPLFLTDFLMSSMNIKGVIGILALQGVATLMQKHNIEYPNVYGKLYTMFEPSIFHTKYKSRLFYLANIFLTSIYLPEAMVASFIKRASRLTLTCTAPDIIIILKFVGNLLMRHTGLKKMIHYHSNHEVSEDPFISTENDPMKTRASESSLWEIALLNKHCQPSVSSAAKFIYFNLPSVEHDLNEVLSNTYEDMFESERKKKKQKISLTFERPQGTIAKLQDDRLYKMWSLTE